MNFFSNIYKQYQAKRLQRKFDAKVLLIRRLMADGKIEESGEVLLEAEKLRKNIAQLNQPKEK